MFFPATNNLPVNDLISSIKGNSVSIPLHYFTEEMATLSNRRKFATLNKENCEKRPRSNMVQDTYFPRSQDDYISQVSEEIEGRVTKKQSKEFIWTESRILGVFSRLDEFSLNPLIQGHSGSAPETSRKALATYQGTNEDNSQSDHHPEASVS